MNAIGFVTLPDLSTMPTAQPAVTPKKDGSTFNNIASGISNLFNSAAPIVQAVTKPKTPGVPGYDNTVLKSDAFNAGGSSAPQPEAKSNTLKYALIGVGVLATGFIIYKVSSKKKKGVSGVGCADDVKVASPINGVKKKKSRKRKK